MHILLPPSETKRSGGGSIFVADALAGQAHLGQARSAVRQALVSLCKDELGAAKALKLGVKNRNELQFNLQLDHGEAMPAIERYTGVLYDALDVQALTSSQRAWVDNHVSVQSALFGLVQARDEIVAYRLSASTRLPELGAPLKRVWSEAHSDLDWSSLGWVLDLRSKDYAALAPLPHDAGNWLHVAQRGPEGEVRALNHFNKAAKGDLVRRLAISGAQIHSSNDFIDWAIGEGLEVSPGPGSSEITLVTALGVHGR